MIKQEEQSDTREIANEEYEIWKKLTRTQGGLT